MAEESLSIFKTRADRFPTADDLEAMRDLVDRTIETLPGGSFLTFWTQRIWQPAGARRLEEWLKEFANDFDQHCMECKPLKELVEDEVFVSASMQIARIVVTTQSEEKRLYLRNALLNIASAKTTDEIKQEIFLNAIDAFSSAHVKVLNVLKGIRIDWSRSGMISRTCGDAIEIAIPELKGLDGLAQAILIDLKNRGFVKSAELSMPYPVTNSMSNFGYDFLNFVLLPIAPK